MDALASRLASAAPAAQPAGGGREWWQNASALAFALSLGRAAAPEAHYRFGDAHLAITAPAALRAELSDRYGDCAVAEAPRGPDAPTQRCTVHARGDGLTLVHFNE